MKSLGLSVVSLLAFCAAWAAESTLLDGKVVVTSDDDTGSITSLVATPAGGETLTIPSDAGAMAFAAGATIAMAADGQLIFANDVTAAGALSLARTDGNYYAWNGSSVLTNGYESFSGKPFKEWEVASAFANSKGTRKSTSTGHYTCISRPLPTAKNWWYVINRWDGDYTYSGRIQMAGFVSNTKTGIRITTFVSMPKYERWPESNLWTTPFQTRLKAGEGRFFYDYVSLMNGYTDYEGAWAGDVSSNCIDRVVLRKIGSDVATIGFAGDVALGGVTDIALGVKLAVLPKSGSMFAAPIFTGEGDVEYQRNATLPNANRMKYASFVTVTNGATVTVANSGGLPTNGVVNVWQDCTLNFDTSGCNNQMGISGGLFDLRVHPGATLVMADTRVGMAPRKTLQLFELDAAALWTSSDKTHQETEVGSKYLNRVALLNGSTVDGYLVRVGNDSVVAPCWMAKGTVPSTIGCHLWYFGNGSGTSPSKTFTLDVEDVTGSAAVDLTMNGDILRGDAGATDWSGAIVKSGAGTLLMNGKLTMTRPMQVNGGAFIFGDTGGPAEGVDSVTVTGVAATTKSTTSTQKDVSLAGATLGKTAGALALDTLTVTGGGTLELGPTATMSFTDSSAKAWSGRLTIKGWRARAVRFGTSAEGLTEDQCRLIRTAEGLKLHLGSDGYLVPVGTVFIVM